MGKTIFRNGRSTSIPLGLFYGVITSIFLTLLSSSVVSYLIHSGKVSINSVGYFVMINLIVSTLSGCYIASACIKRLKLVICILSGGLYALLLLMMNALFFGGYYEGTAVTILLILGTAAATGIILANEIGRKDFSGKRRFVKMNKKLG